MSAQDVVPDAVVAGDGRGAGRGHEEAGEDEVAGGVEVDTVAAGAGDGLQQGAGAVVDQRDWRRHHVRARVLGGRGGDGDTPGGVDVEVVGHLVAGGRVAPLVPATATLPSGS